MKNRFTKIIGTIIFFFLLTNSFGQSIEEASAMFARKQLDSAFIAAKNLIEHDKSEANAYVLAGRILAAKKKFSDAKIYLEKAQTFSDAPAYSKAWTLCELASCNFSTGDYKKSKENLSACIELNATKNATAAANFSMLKFGFDKFYDSWTIKETKHFIFHFQDTSSIEGISDFVKRKEKAFDSINVFFQSNLPKKIDYFVWNNSEAAQELLKRNLAFTDAALCITHTDPKHTLGHEMTHSISYSAVPNAKWNRLIAEGICVYFDLSKRNNLTTLKDRNKSSISIADIWKSDSKLDEEIVYPLGGELVKRLIDKFGKEKFMQLLANQSFENAKLIYGSELETTIGKLEDELKQ